MLTVGFEDHYFDNTFLRSPLDADLDLGEVAQDFELSFDVAHTYMEKGMSPVSLPGLEDNTFLVHGERAVIGIDTQAGLAVPFLFMAPGHHFVVSLSFTRIPRAGVQKTVFGLKDISTPITFDRYPVVEYLPRRSITERLSFKTGISEAWDGTEQRTRLRPYPRSEVTMDYLADQAGSWDAFIDAIGMPSQYAWVPQQHRSEEVSSAVLDGSNMYYTVALTAGALPEGLANAPAGTPVCFYDTSAGTFETGLMFQKATTTNLYFQATTGVAVPAVGDLVFPTELCRMQDKAMASVFPSKAAEVSTTWLSDRAITSDANLLSTSTLYTGFTSEACDFDTARPVVRDMFLPGGRLEYQGISGAIIFDREIGRSRAFNRRDVPQVTFTKEIDISWDKDAVDDFRNFILWTWGRQRSFYFSSGGGELQVGAIVGAGMTILDVGGFGDRLPFGDGVVGIDVLRTNGTTQQYRVESYSYEVTGGVADLILTLDRSPAYTVGEVASVSLLYHVRLASDRVTLEYDDRESVKCRLSMITVKQ
jgi:hypothetical protein